MMDLDSPPLPPGLDPRRVVAAPAADSDTTTALLLSPPNQGANLLPNRTQRDVDARLRDVAPPLRPSAFDSTSPPRVNRMSTGSARRDASAASAEAPEDPASLPRAPHDPIHHDKLLRQHILASGSNSQDTSSTNHSDRVFTPAANDDGRSSAADGNGNGQD